MNTHVIHDTSNTEAIKILESGLDRDMPDHLKFNYHPQYRDYGSNIFKVLDSGRYSVGRGEYWILEDNGRYIASAGWNEYDNDSTIALLLTRMYVADEFRTQYMIGQHVLPAMIERTSAYDKQWITCNQYNISLYKWFVRVWSNRAGTVAGEWPQIYRKFVPIGKRQIYKVDQYVVEYVRKKNAKRS